MLFNSSKSEQKKSTIKTIVIIVFFSLFLLLSLLYFFSSKYGEQIICDFLEKKLEQLFEAQVSIANLETNLFSRVQLQNIEIKTATDREINPLLSIENIRIEYRLSSILRKKEFIDTVTIDNMDVYVSRDINGFNFRNVQRTKKTDSEKTSPQVSFMFEHLNVSGSSITVSDQTIPLDISADNINVLLSQNDGSAYDFQCTADSWNGNYNLQPIPIRSFSVKGSIDDKYISVEQLELDFRELHAIVKSTIDISVSPFQIEGDVFINGNPGKITELFRNKIPSRFYPQFGNMETVIGFAGTTENPNISFSTNLEHLVFEDIILDSLIVQGTYAQREINLNTIQLEVLDGVVKGQGNLYLDSLLTHDFIFSVEAVNVERVLKLIYDDYSPYKGRINGKLQTSGPVKNFQNLTMMSQLSLENISYQDKKLSDFNIDMSYDQGIFNVTFNQNDTNLTASASLIEDTLQGGFTFHTTTPSSLSGFAKIPELYGSIDAKGVLSGTIKNPSIITDISGNDIRIYGFPLDSLKGKVIYENKNVSLEKCAFSGNVASVDSLANHFNVPDLSGGLQYNGIIDGPLNDPSGQIDIHFTRPAYKNFAFDNIDAIFSITDRKVVCEYSRIEKDSLAVELHGNYTIPSSSGDAEMVFSRLIEGSSRSDINEKNDIIKKDMSVSDELYFGEMNLTYAFADSGNILLNADGINLDIGQIIHMYSDSLQITGILDFNFEFNGSLAYPTGSLSFFVDDPEVNELSIDSVSSILRIDPDNLTIDKLEMFLNKQRTLASAEIGLKRSPKGYPAITKQSPVRCIAEGKNISIQLLNLIKPPEMSFTGSSTYNLECKGTVGKPGIRGIFNILDAELLVKPDTPPIENLNIRAVLQDSVLIIDPAEGTINGEHVIVNGSAATNDWEQFRTEVSVRISDKIVLESAGIVSADTLDYLVTISDLDIAAMQTMISNYKNMSGKTNAMLKISGALRDPVIEGYLNVADIAFTAPLLKIPITQGYAVLQFDRNTVHLDSLSANVNKGKFFASGTVVHNQGALTELDLNAGILNIMINRPKEYSLTIDSALLNCKKHDNYYDLGGEIVLGESRLVKDFPPKSFITFLQKVERPSKTPAPILQQIRTNVLIKGSQKLWIDNNLARMRIRSEISMIGTVANPNVTGRLSVEEGYVIYLNKKFKITRGIVDSFDQNRFAPIIDFQAETNLKSFQTVSRVPYDVSLIVNGTMDKITFDLTSNPPEDKSDIIALLTVGATRNQLTGRNSDGTDVSISEILKDRAEELSSQKVSSYFSQKAGNLLGLEEITIEGNLFQAGKSSGPQLITSEKLTNRMDITYSTAVGHLNDQRIRLDYLLNKNFSLVGETDQKERTGIDLKYRLRFK
ncbi:translocation/assembly module TamB domain-containing protein [Candidatus Latescibacterota bacterium]